MEMGKEILSAFPEGNWMLFAIKFWEGGEEGVDDGNCLLSPCSGTCINGCLQWLFRPLWERIMIW